MTLEQILEASRGELERVEESLNEMADNNQDSGYRYGFAIGQQVELTSLIERLESVEVNA